MAENDIFGLILRIKNGEFCIEKRKKREKNRNEREIYDEIVEELRLIREPRYAGTTFM